MSHVCHATGCEIEVPEKMFMCRKHWFALPKNMRDRIWHTYVPGQEISKTPSANYLEIAAECVKYLEEKYPVKK